MMIQEIQSHPPKDHHLPIAVQKMMLEQKQNAVLVFAIHLHLLSVQLILVLNQGGDEVGIHVLVLSH